MESELLCELKGKNLSSSSLLLGPEIELKMYTQSFAADGAEAIGGSRSASLEAKEIGMIILLWISS